jgi:hypothetical protein
VFDDAEASVSSGQRFHRERRGIALAIVAGEADDLLRGEKARLEFGEIGREVQNRSVKGMCGDDEDVDGGAAPDGAAQPEHSMSPPESADDLPDTRDGV